MKSISERFDELLNEFKVQQQKAEQHFQEQIEELRHFVPSSVRSANAVICERAE